MHGNYSDIRSQIIETAITQKGHLERPVLIEFGMRASTNLEKMKQFFKTCLAFIREGSKRANEKKDEFFFKKSVSLITDINLMKLSEKITDISPTEQMAYLRLLEPTEVLVEGSRHWTSIQTWHEGYRLIQEARSTPHQHWLKAFAVEGDLGKQIEVFDLFQGNEQLSRLLKLDQLEKQNSGPHFTLLLQFVLGTHKLKNLTENQINDLKACLTLYSKTIHFLGVEALSPEKLSALLRYIDKGYQGTAKEKFQVFLTSPPKSLLIQVNNLKLLKEAGKESKTDREVAIIQELVPLLTPYLIDLDLEDSSTGLSPKEKEKEKEHVEREHKRIHKSVRKLVEFCVKEIDKNQIYSPQLLARGIVELLDRERDPAVSPSKNLHQIAEKCDALVNGKVIAAFQTICFRLYVEDEAKAVCKQNSQPYSSEISDLVEGLAGRFSNQENGLHTPEAAAYVKDLIGLAITLSASARNFDIVDALDQEALVNNILFDVKEIHKKAEAAHAPLVIPKLIKKKLVHKLRHVSGNLAEPVGILKAIRNNPFAIVSAFFPKLIEELVAKEDRNKVQSIRRALDPLGPYFNQSVYVEKGVGFLTNILALILPGVKNPNAGKEFLIEKINGFNALEVDDLARLADRDEIRQTLADRGLGVWMTANEMISDRLIDAHRKIIDEKSPKGSENDPLVEFIRTTLPDLVKNRETITTWIKRIPTLLPILRKVGGGAIANQILKRYIADKLEKNEDLDPSTKELIAESMESIIQTALLASPALLQKHNIDRYFDFFDKLNQAMNNKKLDKKGLFIEVMKIVQNLTRELAAYGTPLEVAIDHTIAQTKVS